MSIALIKKYVLKFIIFILAFQILNLSVHSGDYSNSPFQTGYAIGMYNQIDCAAEFLTECVFSNQDSNLFKDQGLHNHAHHLNKLSLKYVEFVIGCQILYLLNKKKYFLQEKSKFSRITNDRSILLFIIEILSPPPQIA